MGRDIYLSGLAYEIGERRELAELQVDDVEARDRLLANGLVGYRHSDLSPPELAVRAFRKTMAAWTGDPRDVEAVLYCSERFSNYEDEPIDFKQLCEANGIHDCPVIGVGLGECANLAPAFRIARALIHFEGLKNVAIVTASTTISPDYRLSFFDLAVMSDGAASCIVSGSPVGAEFRMRGIGHASSPCLRQVEMGSDRAQLALAVATGVRRALTAARADAGLDDEGFPCMVSTTTHVSAMELIGAYCGVPSGGTFVETVESFGHCYSADPIINLVESAAWREEKDPAGNRPFLLLAMSVSTWGAMICEAVPADVRVKPADRRPEGADAPAPVPAGDLGRREQVIELLVNFTGDAGVRTVSDEADLGSRGIDPLLYENFLMALDRSFDLQIPDRGPTFARMTTLRGILDVIEEHSPARRGESLVLEEAGPPGRGG